MSGMAEALRGARILEEDSSVLAEVTASSPAPAFSSLYREQVRLLAQKLFLDAEHVQSRHVGFVAADLKTDVAPLCLSIAQALSEQGKHDVGLIDARPHISPLKFQTSNPELGESTTSEIESRLWIVQRQAWINGDSSQAICDGDVARLRDISRQFEFSILCCGAMGWQAARIGRVCDGLVLVLTANQTRKLVAQNIRGQLRAAQVPILGTVLAERRFPIPTALYRKL